MNKENEDNQAVVTTIIISAIALVVLFIGIIAIITRESHSVANDVTGEEQELCSFTVDGVDYCVKMDEAENIVTYYTYLFLEDDYVFGSKMSPNRYNGDPVGEAKLYIERIVADDKAMHARWDERDKAHQKIIDSYKCED
jgi:hypothetical protein